MNIRGFLDKVAQILESLGGAKINLSEPAIELLLPNIFRFAVKDMMSRGGNVQDVVRSHFIELKNGQADLPANILTEYLKYSFLPEFSLSSWLPHYADYVRGTQSGGGLSDKFCYYAIENGKFYSNCPSPVLVRTVENILISENSNNFLALEGLNLTFADVGKRIRIMDGETLLVDSIIDKINDKNSGDLRGRSLAGVESNMATATIYETTNDRVLRELEDIFISADDNSFTTTTPSLTESDIGRRIRVYNGLILKVDAYLKSVTSPTSGTLTAEAVSASTGGVSADVLATTLTLNAPTVPLMPTNESAVFDATEELVNKALEITIAVLRGEIPLAAVSEEKQ